MLRMGCRSEVWMEYGYVVWQSPPLPCAMILAARLRKADGGAVAGVRDGKRAGRGAGVEVRAPASRARRHPSHERTTSLAKRVGHDRREVGQPAGERAHVSGVDADGRREGPGIGLGLGQARTGLDVGIQPNGDRGEDADDRDEHHQLDEGEAALLVLTAKAMHDGSLSRKTKIPVI